MSWHLQDPLGTVSGPLSEYDVVIKIHRREAGASFFIREGDFEAWRPLPSHPAFLDALYRIDAQDRERQASAERLRNQVRSAEHPGARQASETRRATWQNSPWVVVVCGVAFGGLLTLRACNNWWDGLGAEARELEARNKAYFAQQEAEARAKRAADEQTERERKAAIAGAKAEEAAREAARSPSERALQPCTLARVRSTLAMVSVSARSSLN